VSANHGHPFAAWRFSHWLGLRFKTPGKPAAGIAGMSRNLKFSGTMIRAYKEELCIITSQAWDTQNNLKMRFSNLIALFAAMLSFVPSAVEGSCCTVNSQGICDGICPP